eukprot:COSAG05_NODE_364_length_10775_cov_3.222836_9_plen_61_part_00
MMLMMKNKKNKMVVAVVERRTRAAWADCCRNSSIASADERISAFLSSGDRVRLSTPSPSC